MILPSWQIKHPHRTIDEAIDLDEIPDLQYRYLLQKLVSDQALANPVAAVAFAMRLEDEEIRVEMVSDVVESWAIKDPAGAGQWAAALPEGEIRDLGLSKVSERLAITDLDSARELVREIGDRRTKGFAVHRMMTAGRVIKHHFEAGLRLADEEMSEMPYDLLHAWALYIRPEDVPAFRTWLENARDSDRIKFHPYHQPDQAIDPEKAYGIILHELDDAGE